MTKKLTLRARPEQHARDLASAKPGEIVMIDQHGKLMTPARVKKANVAGALIGGAVTAGALIPAFLLGGWIAGLVVIAVLHVAARPLTRFAKHAAVFREVNALVLAGDREAARVALAKLPVGRPGPLEAGRLALEASITYMFGDHAGAIERCQRCLAMVSGPKHARFHDSLHLGCAGAYAELGDVERSRHERALVDPETERGDIERFSLIAVDLQIAFVAKRPDELPEDELLHDWARLALQYHHSGSALVALAWAFSQRADDEMADHLLASAVDRSDARYFADAYPRLEAWRTERLAARPLPAADE